MKQSPDTLLYFMDRAHFLPEEYNEQMHLLRAHFSSFCSVFDLSVTSEYETFSIDGAICLTTDAAMAEAMQDAQMAVIYLCRKMPESFAIRFCWQGLEEISYEDFDLVYHRAHRIPLEIVRTEHCVLREFGLSDLDALEELYRQPHVTDFVEPLFDHEEELSYETQYIDRIYAFYGYGMWLVFEKESGRLIGRAGIESTPVCDEDCVEMGYLFHPNVWGRGIATEVCRAIMHLARERFLKKRMVCRVHPDNDSSRRLMTRLGFQEDGVCDGDLLYTYRF